MGIPIQHQVPFNSRLEVVRFHQKAIFPIRAYSKSAAYDLSACLSGTMTLGPQTTKSVPTGIGLRAPANHCILICSRSGMATNSVFVANGPGVVDPDYTGEIRVLLYNGGLEPHYIKSGDRVAQALVIPFASLQLLEIARMPDTERGTKGFGSSGQ